MGVRRDRPQVMVIGLDSATWAVIRPLLAEGRLPNLGRLIAEGAHGPLRSCIPYVSAPAWVSFATGCNPGRHGVFDFARRSKDGYGVELVNANSVRLPTLWHLLSEQGLRVGVLNMPVTYPPRPVRGVLVTGMLTPDLGSDFIYPPELRERFLQAVPGYRLEPTILGAVPRVKMKEQLWRDIIDGAEQRATAASFLLQELGEWDLFAVVFTGLDRLQTYLWDDMDPEHPLHDPASAKRFGEAIPAHYEQLDRLVGGLVGEVDRRTTTVVVMSDHGLGGVHQFFFPNQWLAGEGYLRWRRSTSAHIARVRRLLRRVGVGRLAKRVAARLLPGWAGPSRLRSAAFVQDVDWEQTRAFWAADNGLWLNVRGREPRGIVEQGGEYRTVCEELREKLLALRCPLRGEPVVAEVWHRDELYDGSFTGLSPDLRIVWHEIPEERRTHFAANELWGEQVFGLTRLSGDHMRDGILAAWGRGVQPGTTLEGADIYDLAPTILYLLGQPVPEHMDGSVLSSMLDPALVARQPQVRQKVLSMGIRRRHEFSSEDSRVIEERLRDLGYL